MSYKDCDHAKTFVTVSFQEYTTYSLDTSVQYLINAQDKDYSSQMRHQTHIAILNKVRMVVTTL